MVFISADKGNGGGFPAQELEREGKLENAASLGSEVDGSLILKPRRLLLDSNYWNIKSWNKWRRLLQGGSMVGIGQQVALACEKLQGTGIGWERVELP